MNIAVIGDYSSPEYKDFLQIVKMAKPEETIIDLSRHKSSVWNKNLHARFEDIFSASQVIVNNDFRKTVDTRRDVTYAQERNKDILIYVDGCFRPFPEYAREI